MITEPDNKFRALLNQNPHQFSDRVNTPWETVPDCPEYNEVAYLRIVRTLRGVQSRGKNGNLAPTEGILILGEAGTGKTHLLMRVAKNLGETNHILFVRKPSNEDAVAQHIWAEIVRSLTQPLAGKKGNRTQLDDLLANVFTAVLIPEFQKDIDANRDADLKQRWINYMRADPFNLYNMLGEGERRQDNMERIRRRTLRFLLENHPDVDQKIAHALITYCFVINPERKRLILAWLSGTDIDPEEARQLGLSATWVTVDENSPDTSSTQQREEIALRAIKAIGILSTHYEPLILAFDQLEGLRDQVGLTRKWGDAVREIFTMTPNLLIITCIFPSLWENWFRNNLDESTSERISQQQIRLEQFAPHHGLSLLMTHLREPFELFRLPSSIYPFTESDIEDICQTANSPRKFIQAARTRFDDWLMGDATTPQKASKVKVETIITREDVEKLLDQTIQGLVAENNKSFDKGFPNEQDLFGRAKSLYSHLLAHAEVPHDWAKGSLGNRILPSHFVIRWKQTGTAILLGVLNSEGSGTACAARLKNLITYLEQHPEVEGAVLIRDRRCKPLGQKSQGYADSLTNRNGVVVYLDRNDSAYLDAIYDSLVSIEEGDLTVGQYDINKRDLFEFNKSRKFYQSICLFKELSRKSDLMNRIVRVDRGPRTQIPLNSQSATGLSLGNPEIQPPFPEINPSRVPKELAPAPEYSNPAQADSGFTQTKFLQVPFEASQSVPISPEEKPWDVLIGDASALNGDWGIMGQLQEGRQKLAISFNKPLSIAIFGHMGSGKSYALGVLIENALGGFPGVTDCPNPNAVIAFNFRRNAESRFEYTQYGLPNDKSDEIETLAKKYGSGPGSVGTMRIFGYREEIPWRQKEYGKIQALPILFKASELKTEHWEILLKPPTPQSGYMEIIRDVIRILHYKENLKLSTLKDHLERDTRLTTAQVRLVATRLSFAERWISDDRSYEWSDLFTPGSFSVFDLRAQAMPAQDALKICLVLTDLVRRAKNGVNKVIVFDEAHEFVDNKILVDELQNMLTQIRHDGLSFILATQVPERLPQELIRFLTTRFIFKLPGRESMTFLKKLATNLHHLPEDRIANLGLEKGVCFVQTDDEVTDSALKYPTPLEIRPRCTKHGGETQRQTDKTDGPLRQEPMGYLEGLEDLEPLGEDSCPECGGDLVPRKSRSGLVLACKQYPTCGYYKAL